MFSVRGRLVSYWLFGCFLSASQRRSGDDSKSFSVKRSRQDFKPAVGSDAAGGASSSCEVLEGDKRCKRTASPRVEEADPAEDGPFDVIITLGGGLTSEGEPLPWVVARLRDGNIKFDSEDVFHLLLSRVRGQPHFDL